ncbi:MAG TPA: phosphatidylglycerophosphatase A [Candidatus Bathyarchaeia archaeon]|nr:phosphatidylglycerophosphatase A [Candidatus Bathyarchaeia archaeon]
MEMEIEKTQDYIAVHGDFNVLSSAVYNGGFVKAKTILNVTVSNDFNENAIALFDSLADNMGLERDELVGLMTAVKMENARIVEKEEVIAIITAGIEKPPTQSSSTVNIILLIIKNLSPSAMANAIIVATEAKVAAFFDLDVRYQNGELFTGDATDSVVVACYGHENENEEPFAGRATELGRAIYEVVREGVKGALFNHNTWEMDRPILERLEERGISVEDMVATALELYVPAEGDITDEAVLKARIGETIKKECSDVNVALLLAAALHAEEEEIRTGRAGEAGEADAACIVADELIGIDIAEYIGGKKALFNFFYYDTRKPGILSRLGVFMDDAIGGLIAGCMSKLLG